jgi:hypothetical protein
MNVSETISTAFHDTTSDPALAASKPAIPPLANCSALRFGSSQVIKVPMIIDPIGAAGGNRDFDEDVVACESLDVDKWSEDWAADDRTRNAVMKEEEHL